MICDPPAERLHYRKLQSSLGVNLCINEYEHVLDYLGAPYATILCLGTLQ